jgi:hypothetical protein
MRAFSRSANRPRRAAACLLVGLVLLAACGAPQPQTNGDAARWDTAVWGEGRWGP